MGCGQVLIDKKTKAWVDEQNKINKKNLGIVDYIWRVRIQYTWTLS